MNCFFVGTYTRNLLTGKKTGSQGIYLCSLEKDGTVHVRQTYNHIENPSFLAWNPKMKMCIRDRGMNPGEDGAQIVEADVPVSEMHDFTTYLRQVSQGRGSFTFAFTRYEPLPGNLEAKVIEEAKKFMVIKADDE